MIDVHPPDEAFDMYQLIYASKATKVFFLKEIDALLLQARANNKRLDVTGMLLLTSNIFVQALEGEEAVVKKLYEHIETDPRHSQAKIVHSRTVPARIFLGWQMGFASPGASELTLSAMSKNLLLPEFSTVEDFCREPQKVIKMLETFTGADLRMKVKTA